MGYPDANRYYRAALLVIAVLAMTGPNAVVGQQAEPAGEGQGRTVAALDRRLLHSIYHIERPWFAGAMRAVDASAYPVFYGGVPLVWGNALVFGGGRRRGDAYRLTLAEVVVLGGVVGLKSLVRRPRPYASLSDVVSRSHSYRPGAKRSDPYAFPSGHAALAFAIAASWSLSYPAWYVVAPAAVWASSVALSRVWLGVHYPSDVLAGMVLGTAVAVVVHALGPHITPGFLHAEDAATAHPMVVQIRIPFR